MLGLVNHSKGGLEAQVEESLGLSNTSRLRIEPNGKQFVYMKPISNLTES